MENTLYIREKQFDILNHHRILPLGGEIDQENEEQTFPQLNKNTLKFDDILWVKDYNYYGGCANLKYRGLVNFDNGYFVSIINGDGAFAEYNQYEMAVFNPDGNMICLSDPSDPDGDVICKLDKEKVEALLEEIAEYNGRDVIERTYYI